METPILHEDVRSGNCYKIKLAAADAEVRGELVEHGPHTTEANYEDGRWTVAHEHHSFPDAS